jgi:hypothetical protein
MCYCINVNSKKCFPLVQLPPNMDKQQKHKTSNLILLTKILSCQVTVTAKWRGFIVDYEFSHALQTSKYV